VLMIDVFFAWLVFAFVLAMLNRIYLDRKMDKREYFLKSTDYYWIIGFLVLIWAIVHFYR
jgi:putative copper export protein